MSKRLTIADVTAALEHIVSEAGADTVYRQHSVLDEGYEAKAGHVYDQNGGDGAAHHCLYVWDGKADCLMARLLHALGMPVATLRLHEFTGVDALLQNELTLLSRFPEHERDLVCSALREAQRVQDSDGTWGLALKRYFEVLDGTYVLSPDPWVAILTGA